MDGTRTGLKLGINSTRDKQDIIPRDFFVTLFGALGSKTGLNLDKNWTQSRLKLS